MWHVSSRSGVATLRTAIHLYLLTYLLTCAQVKSSADHVVLYLCQSLLRHLLPECLLRRVWRPFYSRSTLLISNLPGPDCAVSNVPTHPTVPSRWADDRSVPYASSSNRSTKRNR